MQKLTDTALPPALRRECNHVHAGLGTLGRAVGVEQRQLLRRGRWQLVPQLVHTMVTEPASQGMTDDPSQLPVPEAIVEAFEPLEFVHHLVRHSATTASWDDLEGVGSQPEHALLLQAACEAASRFRLGAGFLGPLGGGAIVPEPQRTDDFLALWRRVVERQLECVSLRKEPHR